MTKTRDQSNITNSGALSVTVIDFGAVGDGVADDAPAFQAAFNHLTATGEGGKILVPAGKYRIGSPILFAGVAVVLEGEGYNMVADAADASGTWLFIDDPSFIPFRIAGSFDNGPRGTVIKSLAIQQSHPEPNPAAGGGNPPTPGGWQPTNYPEVFWIDATGGEVTLEDLYVPGCRLLARSYQSGRTYIKDVFGQFFDGLLTVDQCYDVMRVDNVHSWPYWRINSDVFVHCVNNLDLFTLGRVDTPFISNIFTLPARSIVRTVQTPAGYTTKLISHNLTGDFAKYGLWVESPNFLAQITSINIYHEGIPLGSAVPIPGARSIYVTQPNCLITLGSLSAARLNEEAITVTGSGTQILIGEANFELINLLGGSGVVNTALGSIVRFAVPPRIAASGDCPITSPASAQNAEFSLQQISEPNAVNYIQAVSKPTGSAAVVRAVGGDTNVDLELSSKGSGKVAVTAPLGLQTYTVATRPAASSCVGCLIYVSDTTNKVQYSDGSVWQELS